MSTATEVKPKFHYADFPETSPYGEVGIVELVLNDVDDGDGVYSNR